MKNSSKAFTLVELLIVVVIIGILAMAAMPQYQRMVWRARLAEVPVIVGTISQAEQLFYAEHGKYPQPFDAISCYAGHGVDPNDPVFSGLQKTLNIEIPSSCFFRYMVEPNGGWPSSVTVIHFMDPTPGKAYSWAWYYDYAARTWTKEGGGSGGPAENFFVPPSN
jgi:prepilin-type N-terminal cleavage/methylation domain-containing protein